VTRTSTVEPLALARQWLDDAVRTLADPVQVRTGDVHGWSDPLYVRLRVALPGGRRTGRRRPAHTSRLPCRVDVLALLVEIDTTVGSWEHGKTTVERLHQLTARSWRPQDCALINGYGAQLERWAMTAAELLAEIPTVALEVACPRCDASFMYRRDSAGDRVRVRTLRVSEAGCECLACGAFWPPERFEWLARLLGCDPAIWSRSGQTRCSRRLFGEYDRFSYLSTVVIDSR
jgi:hypothetical protein